MDTNTKTLNREQSRALADHLEAWVTKKSWTHNSLSPDQVLEILSRMKGCAYQGLEGFKQAVLDLRRV